MRFLPIWDATLLVHARRTRILPEEYRPRVFNQDAASVGTFLVDGRVAGTWRYQNGRVKISPSAAHEGGAAELDEEAERLAALDS